MSSDYELVKKVTEDRHSVRAFDGKPIEDGVLEEILGYSLVLSIEESNCERDALLL